MLCLARPAWQKFLVGECCSVRANTRTTFYPWREDRHPMQHARKAMVDSPVTDAPHLEDGRLAQRPGGYHGRVDLEPCMPAGNIWDLRPAPA